MYTEDPSICHCEVKFKSNKLLITIGESWTWGDSLDPQTRLQSIYGKHLSEMLQLDWLNIARKGASNFWIFYQISELIRYDKIPYDELLIVFCCTETGREFDENWAWYEFDPTKNLPSFDSVDQCIIKYNSKLMDYLKNQLSQLNPKVEVVISHNFCNSSFWQHDFFQVQDNWVKINAMYNKQSVSFNVPTIAKLQYFKKYCKDIERIVDLQTQAIELVDFLDKSPLHHKKATKHPTSKSHRLWAEHLHSKIR
jgi:hypothetical protein